MVAESLIYASGISIVQDTFQTNCSVLFHHYLRSWADSNQLNIVFFALATPPQTLIKSLSDSKSATIIDCFTNCDGWSKNPSKLESSSRERSNCKVIPCSNVYSLSHLEQLFKQAISRMNFDQEGKKVSVIFDSLGVLMLQNSAGSVRQFLQRLYNYCEPKQSRVVGILHTDAMLPSDLSQMEFGVHTVVRVEKPLATLENLPGTPSNSCAHLTQASALRSQRLLVIRHDRPSGRVAWATEGYGVDANGNLVTMKVPKSAPVRVSTDGEAPNVDPTSNLTFNLKLTEQEQSAKDKLILPYMHHLDESLQDPSKPGSIIYVDSDDDYDEEDPDDDLDI